jgi:hypothetical protein
MHEFNKIIQESPVAISEPLGLATSLVGLVFFLMQKKKHIAIINVFSKSNTHTHIHIEWYFVNKSIETINIDKPELIS